jgi:Leucine-rich repeat (LRR) protein
MGRLQCLESLYANGNLIDDVPKELGSLPKLQKCNLSNNKIEVRP